MPIEKPDTLDLESLEDGMPGKGPAVIASISGCLSCRAVYSCLPARNALHAVQEWFLWDRQTFHKKKAVSAVAYTVHVRCQVC